MSAALANVAIDGGVKTLCEWCLRQDYAPWVRLEMRYHCYDYEE